MQRKKPVTSLLLWLNSWAALLSVVIVSFVIVSFGLTLTRKWGKKKAMPKPLFFFLIASVTRQRLSPGDSCVQHLAITSSQAVYSDCTCIVFHSVFSKLCSPNCSFCFPSLPRSPDSLLSPPELVFSRLPVTSSLSQVRAPVFFPLPK